MAHVSITTGAMLNAFQGFNNLALMKLPVKCSYTVARLLAKLKSEVDIAEAKRIELVKEHGTEQEDGGFAVQGDAMPVFAAKWQEVVDTVIELDVPKLKIEQFGDITVEPAVLAGIDTFIEE